MNKRYYFLLITAFLLGCPGLQAQDNGLQFVITDPDGRPVKGATLYANEGKVVRMTDQSGVVSVATPASPLILVEAEGYEPLEITPPMYETREFTLEKSTPLYGKKDEVKIPYETVRKGDLTGAITTLPVEELMKYDQTLDVNTFLEGNFPGLYGSNNIRGIGGALILIDGLPKQLYLTLAEVEQISVVRDANSSVLYGTEAVNGIIYITTKHGQAYKNKIEVNASIGLQQPKELPSYLNSADYMTLFNEALANDGLPKQFTDTDIENYRSGDPYRYPSTDYYSRDFLRKFRTVSNVYANISGGTDKATYFTSLGWKHNNNLVGIGEGNNAKYNQFNVRGNVDLNINKWVSTSLDAAAIYVTDGDINYSSGNWYSQANTLRPHLYSPFLPIEAIDPDNEVLGKHKFDLDGKYLMGGTNDVKNNPIADAYFRGEFAKVYRDFSLTHNLRFDLGFITPGLTLATNLGFEFYSTYTESVTNNYAVYTPKWAEDGKISSLTKINEDSKGTTHNVTKGAFQRRFNGSFQLNYNRTFDKHHVRAALIGYGNRFKETGVWYATKHANLGLRMAYTFDRKYMVDFSGALVNSVRLGPDNRGAFSPTLGLGWMISSEGFMASARWIDYLKLNLSMGIIHSDKTITGYYWYDDVYTNSGGYTWNDGGTYSSNSGVVPAYGANPDLFFEKRKEINAGISGSFFDGLVSLSANYFYSLYSDRITRPTNRYATFYNNYVPYINYGENLYTGFDLGLALEHDFGDLTVRIGANMLYADSEVKKISEIYQDDYMYRAGKPTDAVFAWVADGLFKDQADIDNSAYQSFGTAKPGDIKYVDQNKDGIIDANDQVKVGRSQSPFSYGINLLVSYKGLTLYAQGTGRTGGVAFKGGSYYRPDASDKYSDQAWNRWTPETASTATLPRLSSQANSNNDRNSTFWMYDNDYFRLNRVQLTYQLPTFTKMPFLKGFRVFARGESLLTLAKNKEILDRAVGAVPNFRTYILGMELKF